MDEDPIHWGSGQYAGKVWDGRHWVPPTSAQLAHRKDDLAHLPLLTTLAALPGYRIVEALGIVSVVGAASGFTAGLKGGAALTKAHGDLMAQATAIGANAVVGVIGSSFGASGGITSVFGGDAVGVLLMGTAVRVVEESGE